MFGLSAHQHLISLARNAHVRIAGQTVPKGHVPVKLRTGLIEKCQLQISAELDLA